MLFLNIIFDCTGSLLWCTGFSLSGFSCGRTQAVWHVGSVIVAHRLSCPVARGISQSRTRVLCIGKWTLNHWTTREVLMCIVLTPSLMLHGECALFRGELLGLVYFLPMHRTPAAEIRARKQEPALALLMLIGWSYRDGQRIKTTQIYDSCDKA